MSASTPIPVPPQGAALPWMMENPRVITDAIQLLNKVATAKTAFAVASTRTGGNAGAFIISDEDAALALPILWTGGVPENATSYSATANANYSSTQIQALMNQVSALTNTVNAILSAERNWQGRTGT